jgi:hypothetical protein
VKTTENLLRLRPFPTEQRKRNNPIESLKNKNHEIKEYIRTLKDERLQKAMEMFKLSIENEDAHGKSTGFKTNINFGYVGYLLKSDYFAKQEKKDYLNNNNQYPNKKLFFFKPKGSRKNSLVPKPMKKMSNFNDYLYDLDPNTSPMTLGRNIKEFSQICKGSKEIEEKQKQLIEYVKQYVRKEEQEFYQNNLNFSKESSYRNQKDFIQSKELKKEIFDFYNNLIDYQENEAEIKEFKDDLVNSFKGYDENFQQFIKELIKYNENLRKIDNDKKTFNFDNEEYAPND